VAPFSDVEIRGGESGCATQLRDPSASKSYPKAKRSTIDIDLHAHNRNAIVGGQMPVALTR
jgi:hypothetical protein